MDEIEPPAGPRPRTRLWTVARITLRTMMTFQNAGRRHRRRSETGEEVVDYPDEPGDPEEDDPDAAHVQSPFLAKPPPNAGFRERPPPGRFRRLVNSIRHQLRVASAFRNGVIREVIRPDSPTASITARPLHSTRAIAWWRIAIRRTRQQIMVAHAFRDALIRRALLDSAAALNEPFEGHEMWRRAIRHVLFQIRVAKAFKNASPSNGHD